MGGQEQQAAELERANGVRKEQCPITEAADLVQTQNQVSQFINVNLAPSSMATAPNPPVASGPTKSRILDLASPEAPPVAQAEPLTFPKVLRHLGMTSPSWHPIWNLSEASESATTMGYPVWISTCPTTIILALDWPTLLDGYTSAKRNSVPLYMSKYVTPTQVVNLSINMASVQGIVSYRIAEAVVGVRGGVLVTPPAPTQALARVFGTCSILERVLASTTASRLAVRFHVAKGDVQLQSINVLGGDLVNVEPLADENTRGQWFEPWIRVQKLLVPSQFPEKNYQPPWGLLGGGITVADNDEQLVAVQLYTSAAVGHQIRAVVMSLLPVDCQYALPPLPPIVADCLQKCGGSCPMLALGMCSFTGTANKLQRHMTEKINDTFHSPCFQSAARNLSILSYGPLDVCTSCKMTLLPKSRPDHEKKCSFGLLTRDVTLVTLPGILASEWEEKFSALNIAAMEMKPANVDASVAATTMASTALTRTMRSRDPMSGNPAPTTPKDPSSKSVRALAGGDDDDDDNVPLQPSTSRVKLACPADTAAVPAVAPAVPIVVEITSSPVAAAASTAGGGGTHVDRADYIDNDYPPVDIPWASTGDAADNPAIGVGSIAVGSNSLPVESCTGFVGKGRNAVVGLDQHAATVATRLQPLLTGPTGFQPRKPHSIATSDKFGSTGM